MRALSYQEDLKKRMAGTGYQVVRTQLRNGCFTYCYLTAFVMARLFTIQQELPC